MPSRAIRDLPYALPLAAVLALLSWLAAPAAGPDAAVAVESLSAPAAAAAPSQVVLQASAAVYTCDRGSGAPTPAAQPCQAAAGRPPADSGAIRAGR